MARQITSLQCNKPVVDRGAALEGARGSGVELQTCSRRRGRASTEMYLHVHSLVGQCRALSLCLLGIPVSCRLAEPKLPWDTNVE